MPPNAANTLSSRGNEARCVTAPCRLWRLLALLCLNPVLLSLGDTPPPLTWQSLQLRDLDGQPLSPAGRWLVLVFISPECPGSNACAPELASLRDTFDSKGATFVAVYADPTAELAALRQHYADYRIAFPAVHDRDQAIASRVQATYTPQAAVLSNEGELLYRGPIDDRITDGCGVRTTGRRRDLHEVLSRLVAGEKGPFTARPGAGCALPEPIVAAAP